ncbi:hypothetical protein G7046_g9445 [Stylonectria norvegica]|nr:hypothetical protein G7046_g9445 [Stylonectria norvegica]
MEDVHGLKEKRSITRVPVTDPSLLRLSSEDVLFFVIEALPSESGVPMDINNIPNSYGKDLVGDGFEVESDMILWYSYMYSVLIFMDPFMLDAWIVSTVNPATAHGPRATDHGPTMWHPHFQGTTGNGRQGRSSSCAPKPRSQASGHYHHQSTTSASVARGLDGAGPLIDQCRRRSVPSLGWLEVPGAMVLVYCVWSWGLGLGLGLGLGGLASAVLYSYMLRERWIPFPVRQAAGIKQQASSIKHQASSIKHQASSIKHQASSIKHQASSIKHQASSINQQATTKGQRRSFVRSFVRSFACVASRRPIVAALRPVSHILDPSSRLLGYFAGLYAAVGSTVGLHF